MTAQIVLTLAAIAIIFLWDSYLYQVLNIKVRHLLEKIVVFIVWFNFIVCIFLYFAAPFYYPKENYVMGNVLFVIISTLFYIEKWYIEENTIRFWKIRKAQKPYKKIKITD